MRRIFDGPLVLAGGVSDGQALWAARVLSCDLAYMGTRFLATQENLAKDAYKQAVVDAELDDVLTTRAFTGLDSNMLRPSIVAAGLDPDRLDQMVTPEDSRQRFGARVETGPRRWTDIWSAGHSVSGVQDIPTVPDLVRRTTEDFEAARRPLSV